MGRNTSLTRMSNKDDDLGDSPQEEETNEITEEDGGDIYYDADFNLRPLGERLVRLHPDWNYTSPEKTRKVSDPMPLRSYRPRSLCIICRDNWIKNKTGPLRQTNYKTMAQNHDYEYHPSYNTLGGLGHGENNDYYQTWSMYYFCFNEQRSDIGIDGQPINAICRQCETEPIKKCGRTIVFPLFSCSDDDCQSCATNHPRPPDSGFGFR